MDQICQHQNIMVYWLPHLHHTQEVKVKVKRTLVQALRLCTGQDKTAWRCAFFMGKKYGSKGYPQINAAHVR